ncbi:MAG: HEAT repeat domain-containing protein [Spirochaetales bacterium]|nr:HEAT repeat domain-containing protein [Spirochaetales bacterium]MCF7939897.1 HEAT repeat domain-containing protein [Spirochaetales bacterium]
MNGSRITGILAGLVLLVSAQLLYSISVVDTDLGRRMERLFPGLSEGYIDLNANDRLDRLEDMDELVPESLIQDNTLQVQEILDFIIENFRFFPLERLQEVQSAVEQASGDIPEIIALNYRRRLNETVEKKKEFGSDDLYLTPSALRRAHEEMRGYIATMLHAFKKEEGEFQEQFIQSREQLFSMMEAGYPLPDISDQDEEVLAGAMIHTILNTGDENPRRVRAAIRTLGRMRAESSLPYLEDLLDSSNYRAAAAQALGAIGTGQARTILMGRLEEQEAAASTDPDELAFENALIRAVAGIGGEESADRVLGLAEQVQELDPAEDGSAESELSPKDYRNRMVTILKSVRDLAEQGTRDRRISTLLTEYLDHESPEFRAIAVEGISFIGGRNAVGQLRPKLTEEKNEEVILTLIESLNRLGDTSVLTSFLSLLEEPGTSTSVKRRIIEAIGKNEAGAGMVLRIQKYLSDPNAVIREATADAIYNLYPEDPKSVIGSLNRGVLQSEDSLFLKEATSILAELSDPNSLTTQLKLLESSYPEVRKNASWGIYRLRPDQNARVVAALQKLVTSETEPLQVRINSVRALGAIGMDSSRLNVEKTLMTVMKLRSAEYTMLRYFALEAIGNLNDLENDTVGTLVQTAASAESRLLRTAALETLGRIGGGGQDVAGSVSGIGRRSEDPSVRIAALNVLGDLGSPDAVSVAALVLEDSNEMDSGNEAEQQRASSLRLQTAYALSRVKTEEAVSLMIDLAVDKAVRDQALGLLQDGDRDLVYSVVTRRIRTEQDEDVKAVLETLQAALETGM